MDRSLTARARVSTVVALVALLALTPLVIAAQAGDGAAEGAAASLAAAASEDRGDDGGTLSVDGLAASDRYGTATGLSQRAHPDGAKHVFVATGEQFADALTGAPAAASHEAPLLFTRGDLLVGVVRSELERLAPDGVSVLGGEQAVSDAVVDDITRVTGADVRRLAGGDRFETAVAISQATHPGGADAVYLATGFAFPDAVTGAPLAFADDAPVLLTGTDEVPEATVDELERLDPERVVALGGEAAISEDALQEAAASAGAEPERVHGRDRYETAVRIAERLRDLRGGGEGFVATGQDWPDAVAAAATAADSGNPVLLWGDENAPDDVVSATTGLGVREWTALGRVRDLVRDVLDGLPATGPPAADDRGEGGAAPPDGDAPGRDSALSPPEDVVADGSRDVTAELNAWIADAPDGATLRLAQDGEYRIDSSVIIPEAEDLTLDGNGAALVAGDESDLDRAHLRIINGDGVTVRNLTVHGANPHAGTGSEAWDSDVPFQHAYDIRGGQSIELRDVEAYDVYGDFVYVGNTPSGWGGDRRDAAGITVDGFHFERNGRQGIAVTGGAGVEIRNGYVGDVRRSLFDLEPNTSSGRAEGFLIEDVETGPVRLTAFASLGRGDNVGDIVVRRLEMHNAAGALQIRARDEYRRGPVLFEDSTLRFRGSPREGRMRFQQVDDITIRNNDIYLASRRDSQVADLTDSHAEIYGNRLYGQVVGIAVVDETSTLDEWDNELMDQ